MPSSISFPAAGAIREQLEAAYPGNSPAIRRMKEQILEFVTSPTARVVFLAGPSGVGKSTVARLIAFLKPFGVTDSTTPEPLKLENMRYVGPNLVDHRLMDWYVELPLTGLVESIAESQLFGAARGAYTGAVERPGVFELAQQEEKSFGVKVTGGVVFLDEVGELSGTLQSKLLPVLSNGIFYRVGGEGNAKHLVEYRGVVITASWRNIGEYLRPDLVSRLTAHVIEVPGLGDRADDLPDIIRAVAKATIDRFQLELNRLKKLDVEPGVARMHLDEVAASVAMPDGVCVKRLTSIDWGAHGQLRGLANALDKIIVQRQSVDVVLQSLTRVEERTRTPRLADALLAWVRGGDGRSIAEYVRDFEAEARDELRRRVADDADFCRRLAERLNTTPADLKKHVANLARDRRAR